MAGDGKTNLIIVTGRKAEDWRDFEQIAHEVVKSAPDIAVQLVSPLETASSIDRRKWERPSVTVCLGHPGEFSPIRGPFFHSFPIKKLDQCARFQTAGVATPRSERFQFGKEYLEAQWGEFVILKPLPLELTSKGTMVRLYRTRRLGKLTPATLPDDHFLRAAPGIVQEYIDTGEYVAKWRVLTMFGEPLYSSTSKSVVPRALLDADDEAIEQSEVEPRTMRNREADPTGSRHRLAVDDEILAFARRMHAVFPTLPVLGCDVLRRESDRALFALEINGGGNVWHFSSLMAHLHREHLGGREKMLAQLGAWPAAARALIRTVRQHAS